MTGCEYLGKNDFFQTFLPELTTFSHDEYYFDRLILYKAVTKLKFLN